MEQQSIIISAIALAIILAGVLWYTLTHPRTDDIALSSPFPTPTVTAGAVPPSAALQPDGSVAGDSTPAEADMVAVPTPVVIAPTVTTGPHEITLVILVGSAIVGLWGLREAAKY